MMKSKNPDSLLVALLLIWWIVNLFQAAFTELDADEAYYWVYSQNLSWGYFDHPPFIAWLIRMGTVIFGKTTLGVRFFVTLLQPVYLYLFWRLLRPPLEATVKEATLYFLLCASIPILQVYGFIATPDAPLLFSTVLFLMAYRSFMKKNTLLTACFTGLTIAMLIYGKYHGFLVFTLVILPDVLKLLRNPRFYLIVLVSAILLLPHFIWLHEHNFDSIRFHILERGQGRFMIFNLIEYFYNTILCYHPFLFLLFIAALIRRKPTDNFERSLYFMTIGFYLFFLFSIRTTAVQPQWLLPTALSICFILFKYLKNKPKTTKIVYISAYVSIAAYMIARVFLIAGSFTQIDFLFFQNKENNRRISQAVGNCPVVFQPHYVLPSIYMFYNEQLATTQLSIYSRSNQYKYLDYDDQIAGKTVAIESPTGSHIVPLAGEKQEFRFDYYENYLPVRRMTAEFINLPENLSAEKLTQIQVKLTNPYSYNIIIGNEKEAAHVHFVLKQGRKVVYDVIPEINSAVVNAKSSIIIEMNIKVSNVSGISDAYICIQQPELHYAPNNDIPQKNEDTIKIDSLFLKNCFE